MNEGVPPQRAAWLRRLARAAAAVKAKPLRALRGLDSAASAPRLHASGGPLGADASQHERKPIVKLTHGLPNAW